MTGRIYLAGAAVYVNKNELAWLNFLHLDMMSLTGILLVLFVIFVMLPKARREGRL